MLLVATVIFHRWCNYLCAWKCLVSFFFVSNKDTHWNDLQPSDPFRFHIITFTQFDMCILINSINMIIILSLSPHTRYLLLLVCFHVSLIYLLLFVYLALALLFFHITFNRFWLFSPPFSFLQNQSKCRNFIFCMVVHDNETRRKQSKTMSYCVFMVWFMSAFDGCLSILMVIIVVIAVNPTMSVAKKNML